MCEGERKGFFVLFAFSAINFADERWEGGVVREGKGGII